MQSFFWIKLSNEPFNRRSVSYPKERRYQSNALVRLTPWLDSKGLLRIRGRLQSSFLLLAAQHPLILPRKSILTSLVISHAHSHTMHGGTQATTAFIRNEFWIVGGRTPVRSYPKVREMSTIPTKESTTNHGTASGRASHPFTTFFCILVSITLDLFT